jgi:hypothetical protein
MKLSKKSEEAYADLNIFNVILNICENSIFTSNISTDYQDKIGLVCRNAMQDLLAEYDENSHDKY